MNVTEYPIRDARGVLRAIHVRRDTPAGKAMAWLAADRSSGLGGIRVDGLPLYRSELVPGWLVDTWIVVTEGESDCDALAALGVPALATVTGATRSGDSFTAPSVDALRDVAPGRRFVLWPDNDDVGRGHMSVTAANLYRAGARSVRIAVYKPASLAWPKGAGARDLIGTAEPMTGLAMIEWMIEEWAERILRPPAYVPSPPSRPAGPLRDTGSVSDALIARGVPNARPGRTVRCPAHEDRHASLSILRDDLRAVCKSGSCPWAGRGVIAADILRTVPR